MQPYPPTDTFDPRGAHTVAPPPSYADTAYEVANPYATASAPPALPQQPAQPAGSVEPESSVEPLQRELLTDAADTVTVSLGPDEVPVTVLPQRLWRSSAMRALNRGDFEAWAEKSLTEAGYDVWLDVDPTVEEIEAFFEEFAKTAGISPGGSRASRRSSNAMRRR